MEDIVLVQSQDYAQVVFEDLNESYPENQDLECVFTLNELVRVENADWVGIYKVGFTNCRDFVCKKEINADQVIDLRASVVFNAEQIPRDDGEFYQFVFVSQAKQIRGASIPFQFKKRHLSDFIEIEDQEAIIYKSKESAMNETLTEMRHKNEHLNAANDSYAKLMKENEEIIACLKDELSSVKLRCLKLTMDNDRLTHTLKTKTENLKNLQDQLSTLVSENSDLQSKYDNLQNGQMLELEKKVSEQVEELNKLREQLKRNEQIVLDQSKTIQSIVGEKDNLANTVTKILGEKADIDTNYQNLMQEFTMCRDKLSAAEQCKEMLRSQLTVTCNELKESSEKNTELNNQIADYLAKCKNSDLHLSDLNEKIESLKAGYENKLNEINGSYYALKLAHSHLETRLRGQDKDGERLRQQNEELKDRIRAGGKEYSKLFEKYRLLKNK
ncbi:tax1-binding 1, partial [Brachionus plicatilis]